MFKEFFLNELLYALKRPMTYIFFFVMALMVFGAVSSDNIVIGGTVGNVYKNSPHVITMYTNVLCIFGLLIATAFFNNAALKDYENNFNEILFSTPIAKSGYFFGRFFAALLLSTVPLLGIFFGVIAGSVIAPAMDWIGAERIGPFYAATFINNYLLFIVPNMFFAGTIIFALSNKWKSTVISFVGALVIIVGYIISTTLLSDVDNETLAALTDVFGIGAYAVESKYFTPIEKNTLSPSFNGLLFYNRLIWVTLGSIILTASYLSFSFTNKEKSKKAEIKVGGLQKTSFIKPYFSAVFNGKLEWQQFFSFFSINFLSIIKSTAFKILFLFSAIILITGFFGAFEYYGLQSYPVTYKMVDSITGASTIFIFIILIFFSGELIWRDRNININEVIDATPHTSYVSLFAKVLSLISILVILHFFLMFVCVLYQLFSGYTFLEMNVYLGDFLISSLPKYAIWSMIFIFIQVLINNKYVGYFVSILVMFLLSLFFLMIDVESNMLEPGESPNMQYSDMNEFGPALISNIWFKSYWLLFGAALILFSGLIWVRGVSSSLFSRLKGVNNKLTLSYAVVLIAVLLIWIGTAGFIYYNTQVLNKYKTSDELEQFQVDYEKTFKKYQNITIPKITDVKYQIDIFPDERKVFVKAEMKLFNDNNVSIDSIHYSVDSDWNQKIYIPNAELVFNNAEFGYQIYQLSNPLPAGDSISIAIESSYIASGFENEVSNMSVLKNGTFLNNFTILPYMGYNKSMEIEEKNLRRKYGLPAKERMAELKEPCEDFCGKNYLSNGRADLVSVETIISTSKNQTAIAPGSLQKQWMENDRNYYHYKLDHPSQNFYSFISAEFELATEKWNDIDIEVYYNKKHPYNVQKMIDVVKKSFDYYTKNFGPYYHKQARIIEFPRYESFAQAFPGTMPYSEAIGFIINLEDEGNSIVDAVIAHEMAHQWWAHQEMSADVQGGTMLTESFAEYSSLMVMKEMCNNDDIKMKEFLKYDYERYLKGRSREESKELPLYKVENQPHIHYGKGSVVLYALQDYIGEDAVNAAMRSFLEAYRYQKPPYPTTLDFLKYLEPEIPDSLNYIITDFFKEITLYDLRVSAASCKKTETGKYLVNMAVQARKMKADTMGNETTTGLNDWIDIGVFADSDEKLLIYNQRVKMDKENMNFSFEVDTLPAKAAVDPRRILIERVYSDNVKGF